MWLLLARAAADSGRTDEALRLEQRLSESTEPGVDEGAAAYARLWTQVRLARMWLATDDATTRTAIRRRVRETGALRDPPDVFVALSWSHPDDALSLGVHYPGYDAPTDAERFDTATLGGTQNGIWALRIREREDGDHLFQITRADTESLRETDCELLVIVQPGTEQERILRAEVHLTRELRTARFRLTEGGDLEPVPVPPPRPATR